MGNRTSQGGVDSDGLLDGDGPHETEWLQPAPDRYGAIQSQQRHRHQQHHQQHHPHHLHDPVYRDYHDLAVTVVENEEHQPIVVHDLSGPVLAEFAGLERSDSIMSSICSEPVDLKSVLGDETEDTTTVGHATVPQEIASMAKNLIGCGALRYVLDVRVCTCAGVHVCLNFPSPHQHVILTNMSYSPTCHTHQHHPHHHPDKPIQPLQRRGSVCQYPQSTSRRRLLDHCHGNSLWILLLAHCQDL